MRLKSFTAATMKDAMAQIRQSLGEDAIIISTFRGGRGRGVQVTAAVEADLEQEAREQRHASAPPGSREALADSHRPVNGSSRFDPDFLYQALLYHSVPTLMAERLWQAASSMGTDDTTMALAGALDHMFEFAPLPAQPSRPLMMAGPPGAGKTVTIAKMAARAALNGRTVHVITSDTVRAGGVDQLACFTDLLNIDLQTAANLAELERALGRVPAGEAVFIDTPGTNPYNGTELDDLMAFAQIGGIEPVLVVPAGGDANEAGEFAQAFARVGVRRLLATRLDMARRLGSLLTAADAGGLAFCEVSITPFVAHGLNPINPVSLARVLLRDPSSPKNGPDFPKVSP